METSVNIFLVCLKMINELKKEILHHSDQPFLLLFAGNLISIGPGMYPSNRTLDGGGRSILVLGSCEFMHNGTLTGLNYYVASPDWMILQIWRPVSMDAVSMMLVYERMIEPNASVDDITQVGGICILFPLRGEIIFDLGGIVTVLC